MGQEPSANIPAVLPGSALDLPSSTRSVIGFTAAAFGCVILMAVLALSILSHQIEATHETRLGAIRTREMLNELQYVIAALQDAETGERGYIITGERDFLEPYERAEQTIDAHLDRLGNLIADSPSAAIYRQLRTDAREQMTYFGHVIAVRGSAGEAAARAIINTREGKRRMDRIRAYVAQLRASDEKLLAAKRDEFMRRSQRTELLMQVGLSAAVVLVIAAGLFLLRHLRRRLEAEHEATAAYTVLRATLDSISQGICVWDGRYQLAAWNDRFIELRGLDRHVLHTGMTLEEVAAVGTMLKECGPGEQRTPVDLIRAAMPFDSERVCDNGLILHLHGRPMPNGYFILTVSDITAIRISEANYRDQATRLAAILDNIVDAIVTINESGSIESWSQGAERLLGYQAEEVLRRNVSMLMPEPHGSAHDGYVRRHVLTGERRIIGSRRELEALHKEGYRVPIELGISEMRSGKRRLFIGVLRDISDRREIERLKSGFVSTVSHELRTPLTSISGSLGLLAGGAAGELGPKARRLIDIAHVNSKRLVRLINDILDLEKAESGRLEFQLEKQPLRGIVEQALEGMRAFADQYRVRLVMHPGPWDARVLIDRDRLTQVLTNLISNACKFSPAGSTVDIEAREDIDSIQILVRDHGAGIPKEFRPRMFQRFAQADSSDSRAKGGTGLGLSIAKALLERLGGNIRFESEQGRGTTFYVSLPLHQQPPRTDTGVHGEAPVGGTRVLVCEDDPDVAFVLCEMLRKAGMQADATGTARAAKSALLAQHFDLAIVDLHLPDMEGIDLIAELRDEPMTRTLPVIVITAAATTGKEAESLRVLHLADWLQKPIDPQRLLRSIHAAIDGPKRGRARVLHVEDDVPLTLLVRELLSDDADVVAAHSVSVAQQVLQQEPFDLIILDVSLADGSGLNVLSALRQPEGGTPPVILYSASEPSREISQLVQGALVKSRDSVDQLLRSVRALTRSREGEIVETTANGRGS